MYVKSGKIVPPMREKMKSWIILILSLLLVVAVTFFTQCKKVPQNEENKPHIKYITDTVYSHYIDTITITNTVIKTKVVNLYDTLILRDTILFSEAKEYCDSLSEIYFHGIDAEIDSVKHFIPKDTVIITNQTTVTLPAPKVMWGKSFNIGLQGGYGLTVLPDGSVRGVPYIGIGGSIGFGITW